MCESLKLLSLLLPFARPQEVNFFPELFTGWEIRTVCVCRRAVSCLGMWVICISWCWLRPSGENNEGVQEKSIFSARSGL